jgi:predicted ATPase
MRKEDNSFLKWEVSSPQKQVEFQKALNDEGLLKQLNDKIQEFTKQIKVDTNDKKQFEKEFQKRIKEAIEAFQPAFAELQLRVEKRAPLSEVSNKLGLAEFLIYAPENSTLRLQPSEGAIQPLGTKGQGLFKLLQSFSDEKFKDHLADLQSRLHLFGWFDKFVPLNDAATKQASLQIHDRWLASDKATFDQRSANEGFLFVLFYFALLISWRTPKFFAIDNIDTALNPRLCSTLMEQIVELAKKHDKQVICTTHNPAILDGLNLNDDEQRLYTVRRDSEGHTVLRRVRAPEPQKKGELPVRLSEAFLRGIIGGLPDHF